MAVQTHRRSDNAIFFQPDATVLGQALWFAYQRGDRSALVEDDNLSFKTRDAAPDDLPALARLHVDTWNETYPHVRNPPSHALRESQWREAFASSDSDWFCLVVQNLDGDLVGFAKGIRHADPEPRGFSGELSKLYVRRAFHGRGLGRRLLGAVAERFLAQGIDSMLLFSEPANPTGRFFEAMGAERLHDPAGVFHGAYGWRDLRQLAERCARGGRGIR